MQKYQTTVARVLLALVFLGPVILRLNQIFSSADGYMQYQLELGSVGLATIFAPLLILIKLVGGIGLLLGYKTKACAYLLLTLTIFLAVISGKHDFQSMFIHLGIVGGLLLLSLYPQTACSLDNRKK
ncbi:MAG: DoxX family membrane protein [Betaproteobacteria bacterium]|nr:DoxX family membrane protein [Betaproteobacteria bacterium]